MAFTALIVSGFVASLALIVAIGAQNAYVLKRGVLRSHVVPVVAVCMASDAALMVAGTLGVGAAVQAVPGLITVVTWLGAAYLTGYGLFSLWQARTAEALTADASGATSLRKAVATTCAFTFLNPHVYLDTLILVGSMANANGPEGRWWFTGGAVAASVVWFSALGFGARSLAGVLARPRVWQVINVVIGMTMLALAATLVTSAAAHS